MFASFVLAVSLATTFFFFRAAAAIDLSDDSLLPRLDLSDGKPAFKALFPPFASRLEAPLAIRFAYVQAIAKYEIAAACHPKALSFFGTKDKILSSLCQPIPRAIILCHLIYRINAEQFPIEAAPFGNYLAAQGLTPLSDSTDTSSPSGWANVIAKRANQYLSSDGWNSKGDPEVPAPVRKLYGDTSGYVPKNKADISADFLPVPLRWQPLTEDSGATGGYKYQMFTVPHLGFAKTLALSKAGVAKRIASAPYQQPGRARSLSTRDGLRMKSLLNDFVKRSRKLTAKERFLARWWENKRISLGSFLPFYAEKLGLSSFEQIYICLAQAIAQHDSLIVGWREKRYHDLVRPTTMIQRYYTGKKIKVFISEDVGVQEINGEDYKPLTSVQAHPEFPSGSSLLCYTGLQSLYMALKSISGTSNLPRFELKAQAGMFGFPHNSTINVGFRNLREAAANCGESRLWAGVHFPPSVEAGADLASGIGSMAFKQVKALVEGEVPRSCNRCIKEK